MAFKLSEITVRLGGELIGEDVLIRQVADLTQAQADQLGFVANAKYSQQLASSAAGAVILNIAMRDVTRKPRILTDNPHLYFAQVAALLNPPVRPVTGVHGTALIDNDVVIDATASIGPFVTIGQGVRIGARTIIAAGCRLGTNVVIGADCWIHPNVVIQRASQLGDRCIVHPGAVIGADGFGNVWDTKANRWYKIPQLGSVRIGSDVEIGASTTVDCGALGDTVIEDGVRLDNQIQIAHNVHIGAHTAMAGCVGIAGSTRIGAYCTFGGSAMILGHLEIADRVNIMAGTLVGKSILKAGTYVGQYPVQLHEDWLANASHLRRLDSIAGRLKTLERKIGRDDADEGDKQV